MLNLLDKVNKMDALTGGAFTFVLGLLVTFLGIIIIVVCVTIVGKILNIKLSNSDNVDKKEKVKEVTETKKVEVSSEGEIPEHVKVAIIAAISAYYDNAKEKCDFVVRKIRRF